MDSFEAVVTPFLKKLLILVNDTPKEVGEWDEEGKVFIVKLSAKFEESLRRYFKGTLQTFIRQLHFYGFSKMDIPRNNTNSWSFSHPFFLRDQPALITNIKRKVSSQNSNGDQSGNSNANRKKGNNNNNNNSLYNDVTIQQKDQEIESLRRQVSELTDTVNELINFVGFKRNVNSNKYLPALSTNFQPTSFPQFVAQNVPTIEKFTKKRMAPDTSNNSELLMNNNNNSFRNEPREKRSKNSSEDVFAGFLEFSGLPLMDLGKTPTNITRRRSDDENTVASVSTEDLMSDFVREFESPSASSGYSMEKNPKYVKIEQLKLSPLPEGSMKQDHLTV